MNIYDDILLDLQQFHCQELWKFCKNFSNIRNDNYGLKLIDNIDYFIDIGSCLGEVAFTAHKLYNPTKIIAVEASSKNFQCLSNNIGNLDNIILYNKAIYHTDNVLVQLIEDINNIGQNKINDYLISDTNLVESITIDNIFDKHNIDMRSRIFIKIDCEGSEKYLLNNPLLLECKQISIEIHERYKDVKKICDLFYKKILQSHIIVKGNRKIGKNYEIIFQKKC